jgi:bla regulator protein blaR1
MISELANHLWQSTLFAVAIGLLTLMCRKNRAGVRYWLWLSASVKVFVPFALLMALGARLEWASTAAQQIATPAASVMLAHVSAPFVPDSATVLSVSDAPRAFDWPAVVLLGVWAAGVIAIAAVRLRMWREIRAAVRASSPWSVPDVPMPAGIDVRSTPGVMEPGVVGLARQVVLMPAGIEDDLTTPQLGAVLMHECCHIRRRDNVTAAVHMVAEAVFWFFPVVWWIGSRLVDERERACDEEVVRNCGEPRAYAEGIVNVCKRYVEMPLACVSGVSGSNVKTRIRDIMTQRTIAKLGLPKKVMLALLAVVAVVMPMLAQSVPLPSATEPRFEAASIKRTTLADCNVQAGGVTPGRIHVCGGLSFFIQQSYELYAKGRGFNSTIMTTSWTANIEGAPAWLTSEVYQIEAKAEGNPPLAVMMGPMLQALFEDRLKLKVHRVTREVPVYELTVAKGGPKVRRLPDDSCVAVDRMKPPPEPPAPGQAPPKPCGGLSSGKGMVNFSEWTVSDFSQYLGRNILVRPIIDKTGLAGRFNFHLEFAPDENTPMLRFGAEGIAGPSIFTAIEEQLGLKLEPARGPHEFLVIDSVERPTEN